MIIATRGHIALIIMCPFVKVQRQQLFTLQVSIYCLLALPCLQSSAGVRMHDISCSSAVLQVKAVSSGSVCDVDGRVHPGDLLLYYNDRRLVPDGSEVTTHAETPSKSGKEKQAGSDTWQEIPQLKERCSHVRLTVLRACPSAADARSLPGGATVNRSGATCYSGVDSGTVTGPGRARCHHNASDTDSTTHQHGYHTADKAKLDQNQVFAQSSVKVAFVGSHSPGGLRGSFRSSRPLGGAASRCDEEGESKHITLHAQVHHSMENNGDTNGWPDSCPPHLYVEPDEYCIDVQDANIPTVRENKPTSQSELSDSGAESGAATDVTSHRGSCDIPVTNLDEALILTDSDNAGELSSSAAGGSGTQYSQVIDPMPPYSWSSVADAGPTVSQHCMKVSYSEQQGNMINDSEEDRRTKGVDSEQDQLSLPSTPPPPLPSSAPPAAPSPITHDNGVGSQNTVFSYTDVTDDPKHRVQNCDNSAAAGPTSEDVTNVHDALVNPFEAIEREFGGCLEPRQSDPVSEPDSIANRSSQSSASQPQSIIGESVDGPLPNDCEGQTMSVSTLSLSASQSANPSSTVVEVTDEVMSHQQHQQRDVTSPDLGAMPGIPSDCTHQPAVTSSDVADHVTALGLTPDEDAMREDTVTSLTSDAAASASAEASASAVTTAEADVKTASTSEMVNYVAAVLTTAPPPATVPTIERPSATTTALTSETPPSATVISQTPPTVVSTSETAAVPIKSEMEQDAEYFSDAPSPPMEFSDANPPDIPSFGTDTDVSSSPPPLPNSCPPVPPSRLQNDTPTFNSDSDDQDIHPSFDKPYLDSVNFGDHPLPTPRVEGDSVTTPGHDRLVSDGLSSGDPNLTVQISDEPSPQVNTSTSDDTKDNPLSHQQSDNTGHDELLAAGHNKPYITETARHQSLSQHHDAGRHAETFCLNNVIRDDDVNDFTEVTVTGISSVDNPLIPRDESVTRRDESGVLTGGDAGHGSVFDQRVDGSNITSPNVEPLPEQHPDSVTMHPGTSVSTDPNREECPRILKSAVSGEVTVMSGQTVTAERVTHPPSSQKQEEEEEGGGGHLLTPESLSDVRTNIDSVCAPVSEPGGGGGRAFHEESGGWQNQHAVTAHLKGEQLPPFGFAEDRSGEQAQQTVTAHLKSEQLRPFGLVMDSGGEGCDSLHNTDERGGLDVTATSIWSQESLHEADRPGNAEPATDDKAGFSDRTQPDKSGERERCERDSIEDRVTPDWLHNSAEAVIQPVAAAEGEPEWMVSEGQNALILHDNNSSLNESSTDDPDLLLNSAFESGGMAAPRGDAGSSQRLRYTSSGDNPGRTLTKPILPVKPLHSLLTPSSGSAAGGRVTSPTTTSPILRKPTPLKAFRPMSSGGLSSRPSPPPGSLSFTMTTNQESSHPIYQRKLTPRATPSPVLSPSKEQDFFGFSSKPTLSKKRSERDLFQVEVLRGLLGIGIDVEQDAERVRITRIDATSPVARTGQVR